MFVRAAAAAAFALSCAPMAHAQDAATPAATPAPAQTPEEAAAARREFMIQHIVNAPSPVNHQIYGPRQTNSIVNDATVQGGKAMRVVIANTGGNPWDISVSSSTEKEIKSGDVLLGAFWLRSVTPPADGPARLNARIQGSDAPYTQIAQTEITVGPEWKLYFTSATAAGDFAAGKAVSQLHLNMGGAQTIDLGPFYIFNFCAGYDTAKLPTN